MMGFSSASKRKSEPAPATENITLPDVLHIAPGRALVTSRGVLSHCAVIEASDLPGGEERLRELFLAGRILSKDDCITAFRAVESSMHDDDARKCRVQLGIDDPSDHVDGSIPSLPAAKQRAKEAQRVIDNFERQHPGIVAELAHPPSAEQLAENGSYAWIAVGHAGVRLSELGTSVRAAQVELASAKAELARAEQAVTLALAKQSSRYAVAPGRTITLPNGRMVRGGVPISVEDFASPGQRDEPAEVWRHHLASGCIIERVPEAEPSESTEAVA